MGRDERAERAPGRSERVSVRSQTVEFLILRCHAFGRERREMAECAFRERGRGARHVDLVVERSKDPVVLRALYDETTDIQARRKRWMLPTQSCAVG